MAQPRQKIAIVGHSLVWWLNHFIQNDANTLPNLGITNADVRCILTPVKKGLIIDDLLLIKDDLIQFRPDIMVLILGDNDLYKTAPEDLSLRLLAAGTLLRGWTGAAKLIHFELFPRFWTSSAHYFTPTYNQDALLVNERLREGVRDLHQTFVWACHGPSFHDSRASKYFLWDGVHLNNEGQVLLCRAVQKAIHMFRNF